MDQPQSITSLPESPDDERRRRMIQYGVAMGIRVLCVIACFFLHGWWLVVPLIGAVFLPYVAVVLANVKSGSAGTVERPGSVVRASRRRQDEIDG
jgi:predicted tellurium resistance membrane protein TerC